MSGVPERSTSWISSCDPILPSLPAKSSFKFAIRPFFAGVLLVLRAPAIMSRVAIEGFTFLSEAERRCRRVLVVSRKGAICLRKGAAVVN